MKKLIWQLAIMMPLIAGAQKDRKTPEQLPEGKIIDTSANEYRRRLQAALQPLQTEKAAFVDRINKTKEEERNSPEGRALIDDFKKSFTEKQKSILSSFIRKNPGTVVSLEALQMYGGAVPSAEEIKPLYDQLSPQVKASAAGREYMLKLEKMFEIVAGRPAPDFTQNDTLGRAVSLSSFRGKYVLLDFWASWCAPCRAENPELVTVFHSFKNKNFTILSVSLDQEDGKQRWLKAIHDDKLEWTHVSDLKSWKNAAARLYQINELPQNFLIDPKGIIVAKNLKPKELQQKLTHLLTLQGTDSLAELRGAIEQYPDSLALHNMFIKRMGLEHPDLSAQYEKWMQQFPRSATVPAAIGLAYSRVEHPSAHPFLIKTISLDPSNARAWLMLAVEAERSADKVATDSYLAKAAAAQPDDPAYAYYYAMNFEHSDPARWRKMIYALAERFPGHERGAQGLYWLAARSKDPAEKIKVYEQLRTLYPPYKFGWSADGMSALFDIYLQADAGKALALARSLENETGWKERILLVENTIAVRSLIANKKTADALSLISGMNPSSFSRAFNMIALLKAEVRDASGKTREAYDTLVHLFAKKPHDNLRLALDTYGRRIGKGTMEIESDILKIRELTTRRAPEFKLGLYTADSMVSLSDYKGKVVLLTFWFPGCGPCRGEFPHFQAVINKFAGKDVAYLGINVFPEQDPYVLPFMAGTKYTFTPLKGTAAWAKEVYNVRGEPTNFLIDKRGNIVFSDFRTDVNNQRELELMISSLLAQPA